MNLFTKPCATCGKNVLGPRESGRVNGQWLGHDECRDCRKARDTEMQAPA